MGNVAVIEQRPQQLGTFEQMQREARLFATSPLVPAHLRQGTPEQALANCYIALHMAKAMGENPLLVMQNIYIVSGKAGWASQYVIARANASGVFKGRINWKIDRSNPQNLRVTAYATLADTGDVVEAAVDMAMAKAEGWTKNPKYQSMPEVMLRYRSAAFLVRWYCPDVMMGYQTVEEVEDVTHSAAMTQAAQPVTAADIIAQAQGEPEDAPQQPEPQTIDVQPEPQPTAPAEAVPAMDYEDALSSLGMAETVVDLSSAWARVGACQWSDDEFAGLEAAYSDRMGQLKKPRR